MLKQHAGCSLGIRDRRILSLLRIILRLNFSRSRKLFHNNAPVTLHCSPATTILNENPEHGAAARTCNDAHIAQNMEPLTSGRGGGGYSKIQVMGMIKWWQKSKPQKIPCRISKPLEFLERVK